MNIHILCSIIVLFAVSGCYTQLMTPQDYMKMHRQTTSTTISNNSYSINYNQSCTSCHSATELNERAEELEYYGIHTVHDGILLSSHQWLNENPSPGEILYGDPGPVYWPTPVYPTNPWWVPPVTVTSTSSPTSTPTPVNGNRPRTDGSTRDKPNGERDRPIPTPATAQPSASVGGTTSTPVSVTPAPAPAPAPASTPSVIVTPAPTSTPASQPATTESGRTRDSSSDTGTAPTKTRSEGSSRDTSNGSRPR